MLLSIAVAICTRLGDASTADADAKQNIEKPPVSSGNFLDNVNDWCLVNINYCSDQLVEMWFDHSVMGVMFVTLRQMSVNHRIKATVSHCD